MAIEVVLLHKLPGEILVARLRIQIFLAQRRLRRPFDQIELDGESLCLFLHVLLLGGSAEEQVIGLAKVVRTSRRFFARLPIPTCVRRQLRRLAVLELVALVAEPVGDVPRRFIEPALGLERSAVKRWAWAG